MYSKVGCKENLRPLIHRLDFWIERCHWIQCPVSSVCAVVLFRVLRRRLTLDTGFSDISWSRNLSCVTTCWRSIYLISTLIQSMLKSCLICGVGNIFITFYKKIYGFSSLILVSRWLDLAKDFTVNNDSVLTTLSGTFLGMFARLLNVQTSSWRCSGAWFLNLLPQPLLQCRYPDEGGTQGSTRLPIKYQNPLFQI